MGVCPGGGGSDDRDRRSGGGPVEIDPDQGIGYDGQPGTILGGSVQQETHPGVNIAVTGGGSGTGLTALIGGTCDIAESSRSIEPKEIEKAKTKGITPKEFLVALDGIAVVVHPKNPVKDLTADQLREIFLGNITNWKSSGGANKPIVHPVP